MFNLVVCTHLLTRIYLQTMQTFYFEVCVPFIDKSKVLVISLKSIIPLLEDYPSHIHMPFLFTYAFFYVEFSFCIIFNMIFQNEYSLIGEGLRCIGAEGKVAGSIVQ